MKTRNKVLGVLALVGGALLLDKAMTKKYVEYPSAIRGIRNRNPFNIRRVDSNDWFGKVPKFMATDETFEQFFEMEYGIRAGLVLLRNYLKEGNNSLRKILHKFAPKSENNTDSYINRVADMVGVDPDEKLNKNHLPEIATAMIHVESGADVISHKEVMSVWNMFKN